MDGRHRGALPRPAGETGEAVQVYRDVRCDAEDWCRTSHSQLLLLGHCLGRKHHRKVGKPHHVLRGQRVCGGRCLEPKGPLFKTQAPTRGMQCPPPTSRGPPSATVFITTVETQKPFSSCSPFFSNSMPQLEPTYLKSAVENLYHVES